MRQNWALDASCAAFPHSKSCIYTLLLSTPTSNSVCPSTDEADISFENHSCMSWACQAVWPESCTGKIVRESIAAKTILLFPTVTPHCPMLSTITDHISALLLSFRSNFLQTKQSRPVWEQGSKRLIETNIEMVFFGPQSPFWSFFWKGEHWKLL